MLLARMQHYEVCRLHVGLCVWCNIGSRAARLRGRSTGGITHYGKKFAHTSKKLIASLAFATLLASSALAQTQAHAPATGYAPSVSGDASAPATEGYAPPVSGGASGTAGHFLMAIASLIPTHSSGTNSSANTRMKSRNSVLPARRCRSQVPGLYSGLAFSGTCSFMHMKALRTPTIRRHRSIRFSFECAAEVLAPSLT